MVVVSWASLLFCLPRLHVSVPAALSEDAGEGLPQSLPSEIFLTMTCPLRSL